MELSFDLASKSREISESNFSEEIEKNINHLRHALILEIRAARGNAGTRIYRELHAMNDRVYDVVCASIRDELKALGYHVAFPVEHRLGESRGRRYIEVSW